MNPKIIVCVRKRPLTRSENRKKYKDIIDTNGENELIVKEKRNKIDLTKYTENHNFAFDHVFNQNTSNLQIY